MFESQKTLEKIKINSPEVNKDDVIVILKFNKALNNRPAEGEKEIIVDFNNFVTKIIDQHNNLLNKGEMSKKDAIFFIDKVNNKANVAISTQYLKIFKKY